MLTAAAETEGKERVVRVRTQPAEDGIEASEVLVTSKNVSVEAEGSADSCARTRRVTAPSLKAPNETAST